MARCHQNAAYVLLRPNLAITSIGSVQEASSLPTPREAQDAFFAKNAKLGRPMSPWVIYKPQLTTMLSITHRGTGLGLGVLLYGWGISSLASSNTNWSQTLDVLSANIPSSLLLTVKVLAGTAVGYHTINGIRHLAWDMGYGFSLKELYTSGWFVIIVTALIGAAVFSQA